MKKTLLAFVVGVLGVVSVVGIGHTCPAGGKSPSQPMVRSI